MKIAPTDIEDDGVMVEGDTIVAPLTAPGRAAVGIVRISGPKVREVLLSLLGPAVGCQVIDGARKLVFCRVLDPLSGEADRFIDQGLVVFFPGPHSFTGEDVAEIHLHGSPYLIQRLIEASCSLGARLARPGEFSERAFLNGRMDLTQVEAIADLIAAESEAQAQVAREQLEGKLAHAISDLGDPLRWLISEIEAYIDFPEEGIELSTLERWSKDLETTLQRLAQFIGSFNTGRLYREGVRVVICGIPNAGKSSLLNRLLGEERVIVSPVPGTTRDVVEEHIVVNDLLVRICDTAGIVGKEDELHRPDGIELLGIEFSRKRVLAADIVLVVYDPTEPYERQRELLEQALTLKKKVVIAVNKCDLEISGCPVRQLKLSEIPKNIESVFVSARDGTGVDQLRSAVYRSACGSGGTHSAVVVTNVRHVQLLEKAKHELEAALGSMTQKSPPEIIAIELRGALSHLSEIIGVTTTEDLLGLIFSRFCIGK